LRAFSRFGRDQQDRLRSCCGAQRAGRNPVSREGCGWIQPELFTELAEEVSETHLGVQL